jgi:hypothetical protein
MVCSSHASVTVFSCVRARANDSEPSASSNCIYDARPYHCSPNAAQSIPPFSPYRCSSHSLASLKCLLPKKPRLAARGLGCADLRIKCLFSCTDQLWDDASIHYYAHFIHTRAHFLSMCAPGHEDHTLRPWDMSLCLRRRKSRCNYLENRCCEGLPAFVRV